MLDKYWENQQLKRNDFTKDAEIKLSFKNENDKNE